ncbi:MAG: energy-coupling factor transporter ATPase [Gemmatimonadaceae bacterium]
MVAVLGAPGSGKTRLALELAFLATPLEGEALFHGENPIRHRRSRRPRAVTMLVQNAEDQLFARTVFDDVAFGPRHLMIDDAEIERRVLRALRAVRLDPDAVRGRSPFALSGGERRRAALAGVLSMEPEVLILDEPTSNLDPDTRDRFLELLEPVHGRGAIIWFTASAAEAAVADRIYLLRDGATTPAPSGSALLRDWRQLAAAGIELPAVYDLAADLERAGMTPIDGSTPDEIEKAIMSAWKDRLDDR